jgi:hypothetical protein
MGDNSLVGVVICHCPDPQESATILSDTKYVRLVSRTIHVRLMGRTKKRKGENNG